MNHQERKVRYYLLLIQGTYYFFLGLTVHSFRVANEFYLLDNSPRGIYLTTLATVFLLGIGVSLFLAKNNYKQAMSGGALGVITASSFFIHHSFYLYHFDSSVFLWLDWLVQLAIFLCWIWLFYWKWIENKFARL